jgi:hypothetical protein
MDLNIQRNGRTTQLSIYSGYKNAKGEIYLAQSQYITGREGNTVINRHINFQKIENGIIKEVMIDVTGLESIIESNQAGTPCSINGETWTILSNTELTPILARSYSR